MTYKEFTKYAANSRKSVPGSYEPGRQTPFIPDTARTGKSQTRSLDDIYKDTPEEELEWKIKELKRNNKDPEMIRQLEDLLTKRRAAGIQPTKPLEGSWLDRNKDWLAGVGAGTAAGLTTYSLAELHPMLRRARFLRTLLGLGIGAGVGLGTGLLVGSK